MGLWSALGPIATSFLVPHGVAMMRTALEGQMAQVPGPGVRVAFVFPPWLSNTSRAAMSLLLEASVAEPEGGPGESCLEPKKCASAFHTRVWILVLATPGCFLDDPEPGLLCGEEPPTSAQLGLCGTKNPFRSNCPICGRTTPGDSKFPANSAGLPPARLTSPGGEGTLSPRPAETPWACSVWPHLLSSPSLLPPASTNSAASLCGLL